MNLLAVFCYITVTCDPQVAQVPQRSRTTAVQTRNVVQTPSNDQVPAAAAAAVTQRPSSSGTAQTRNVTPLVLNDDQTPAAAAAAAVTQRPSSAVQTRNVTPPQPQPLALNVGRTARPAEDGRKTTRGTSTYPTRYDYIDVEAVMSNDRIIKALFNCVMNRGPCTREGLELRKIVPDAIQTECAKCNDRQRKQAGKVLAHLLQYKPQYWKMLVEKFDPNNVYLKKYMADEDDDKSDDQLALQRITNDTSKNNNN